MANDHEVVRAMLLKMLGETQIHRLHQKEIAERRTLFPSEVDQSFGTGTIKRFYGVPVDDYQKISRWMNDCRVKFNPHVKEFVSQTSGWPTETNVEGTHEFDFMFLPHKDRFDFSYQRVGKPEDRIISDLKKSKEPEIWNPTTREELLA